MKRGIPSSDDDDTDNSSDQSSSNSDEESIDGVGKINARDKSNAAKSSKGHSIPKKHIRMDFEALKQHGFRGGLSVLGVPPPKVDDSSRDWSWSTGKETREKEVKEESYKERQNTRAALADGEELIGIQTRKEKTAASFAQKEKRKRDLGQASRGKSYVEEEKRLLRDSGVYSGFDT